jgi:hypothetical protein
MIPRERLPGCTLLERELAFASSLPEFNYLVSLAGTRTMAGLGEITYDQAEIVGSGANLSAADTVRLRENRKAAAIKGSRDSGRRMRKNANRAMNS